MKRNVRTLCVGIALLSAAVLFLATVEVDAANRVKAYGTLTAVETDGDYTTVIIDEGGYEVAPSAVVLDMKRTTVSITEYALPCHVYYEYQQTAKGPLIEVIREIGE